jgi:hypothetical protein
MTSAHFPLRYYAPIPHYVRSSPMGQHDAFIWCATGAPLCGKPLTLTTERMAALKAHVPVYCEACLVIQELEVVADHRLLGCEIDRPNVWGEE